MLLPALAKAKLRAQLATCLSNEKQMGLAIAMYAGDNGDKFPYLANQAGFWIPAPSSPGNWTSQTMALASVQGALTTNNLLFQYAPNSGVYHCSGDVRVNNPVNHYQKNGANNIDWAYDSYALTGNVSGTNSSSSYSKLSQVRRSSLCVEMLEQCDTRGYNNGTFNKGTDLFANYHGDVNTFCFVDGHAEGHKWIDSVILGASRASVTPLSGIFTYSGYGQSYPSGTPDYNYIQQSFLTPASP